MLLNLISCWIKNSTLSQIKWICGYVCTLTKKQTRNLILKGISEQLSLLTLVISCKNKECSTNKSFYKTNFSYRFYVCLFLLFNHRKNKKPRQKWRIETLPSYFSIEMQLFNIWPALVCNDNKIRYTSTLQLNVIHTSKDAVWKDAEPGGKKGRRKMVSMRQICLVTFLSWLKRYVILFQTLLVIQCVLTPASLKISII